MSSDTKLNLLHLIYEVYLIQRKRLVHVWRICCFLSFRKFMRWFLLSVNVPASGAPSPTICTWCKYLCVVTMPIVHRIEIWLKHS